MEAGGVAPYSKLQMADTTGLARFEIVRVVFLANEVFRKINPEETDWLSGKVAELFTGSSIPGGSAGRFECQIDCDWTNTTREAFFRFLRQLRALCDAEGILLMCDEVQCGYGRPGSLFAHQLAGITPDIASSAKGIGGGFPLGATLLTERVASAIPAGSHGGTYNNNPLAMAVGNAVLDLVLEEGLFPHVTRMGTALVNGLRTLQERYPDTIRDVRGTGLMIGLEPTGDARAIAAALLEEGLVTSPTVTGVLRLVPPLIITEAHVEEALGIIENVIKT